MLWYIIIVNGKGMHTVFISGIWSHFSYQLYKYNYEPLNPFSWCTNFPVKFSSAGLSWHVICQVVKQLKSLPHRNWYRSAVKWGACQHRCWPENFTHFMTYFMTNLAGKLTGWLRIQNRLLWKVRLIHINTSMKDLIYAIAYKSVHQLGGFSWFSSVQIATISRVKRGIYYITVRIGKTIFMASDYT